MEFELKKVSDKEKVPGTFSVIFSGELADCFRMR